MPLTAILIKDGDYFCNEVVNAKRSGMPELLRNNFEAEVLLIDDVQFAAQTDYTTETLLSCLRKRLCDGKRTMMTSSMEPASLSQELADLVQAEGTSAEYHPNPLVFQRMCAALGVAVSEAALKDRQKRSDAAFHTALNW